MTHVTSIRPQLGAKPFYNHVKRLKSVCVHIWVDLMYIFTECEAAPVYKQKQVIYGVYWVHGTTITVSVSLSNQANAGLADCQKSWPAFSPPDGHSHYDRTQTAREHMQGEKNAFFSSFIISLLSFHDSKNTVLSEWGCFGRVHHQICLSFSRLCVFHVHPPSAPTVRQ